MENLERNDTFMEESWDFIKEKKKMQEYNFSQFNVE